MICDLFRNIIVEQNKEFLKKVAERYDLDYEYLLQKYLKPEYYLPVIVSEDSH